MDETRTAAIGQSLCGVTCVSTAAGHELHAIRACAASAMPSRWVDALVHCVREDGSLEVVEAYTGRVHRLWNHADLTEAVRPGEPVALQEAYGVLALPGRLVSVRSLDAAAEAA
ncbi:MAG: hypothetical protein L0L69_08615 [Propionibacterium sp.]|nr:hypothetical protein [Propionibacterium sp.]